MKKQKKQKIKKKKSWKAKRVGKVKHYTYPVHRFDKVKLQKGQSFTAEYVCTVAMTSVFGPYQVHYFVKAKNFAVGERFGVFGSVTLNALLAQVPKRSMVKVAYEDDISLGPSEESDGFDRRLKKYRVEYWPNS